MLVLKTIALLAILPVILSGGGAWGCRSNQNPGWQTVKPATPVLEAEKPSSEVKVLAEGFHSAITNPFVAVVRDAETYAALTRLEPNLPKLDAGFFKTSAVVAVFLGQRNTGGYGVEVTRGPADIQVREKKPGKDMMVTQVITSPFKMVAVDVSRSIVGVDISHSPVWLALDDAWRQRVQSYRITDGKFKMTGGFAGTSEDFRIAGSVGVMREGNLATFEFRIATPSDATKAHALTDFATGVVDNSNININRMSAGSLVTPPHVGLRASGTFTSSGSRLSLNLWSRPSMISDGYSGQGSLEAEKAEHRTEP